MPGGIGIPKLASVILSVQPTDLVSQRQLRSAMGWTFLLMSASTIIPVGQRTGLGGGERFTSYVTQHLQHNPVHFSRLFMV